MTELTFLIDLLLNHKLPKPTREAIAARIAAVDPSVSRSTSQARPQPRQVDYNVPSMPSEAAAGNREAFRGAIVNDPPVAVVAQTPETAAAMAQREAMLAGGKKFQRVLPEKK